MFTIPLHKDIIGDLHIISSSYQELIGGENVIMYTGNNQYGNRILGIIVDEDEESRSIRYFHLILKFQQYDDFIHQKITLLELMRNVGAFYAIDFDYNKKIKQFGIIQFDDVPTDFLPLRNSFCPSFASEKTLNFAISMLGGEADFHRTSAQDASIVQTSIEKAIESAFNSISEMNVEPEVFLEAYEVGSFRINLSVKLKKKSDQISMFSESSQNTITDFISSYVGYTIADLPSEPEEGNSTKYSELKQKLEKVYGESSYPTPATIDFQLQNSLKSTVEVLKPIKERIGKNFNSIQVFNTNEARTTENSMGIVSNEFFQKVEASAFIQRTAPLELAVPEVSVLSDNMPSNYKILVYSFSTKTGKGKAQIVFDDDTVVKSVPLEVKSTSNKKREYSGTKFTRSEHEGRYVVTKGIATRKDSTVTKLVVDIDYDDAE